MKTIMKNNGTVMLMVVFIIALLAAVVMGMLQMNTEEIQIAQNQIYAADALAIAEAGLNDAFAEIAAWRDYESLLKEANFAIMMRGGCSQREVTSKGRSLACSVSATSLRMRSPTS